MDRDVGPTAEAYTADIGYVRKYSASGAVVWEQRFAVLEWETDQDFPMPGHLALDPSGSVLAVSGETYGTLAAGLTNAGNADAFVATFAASDGAPGWVKEWGTAENDNAIAVAIDSQGRVAVTSTLGLSATPGSIRQFDSSGSLTWSGQLASQLGKPPQTVGADIAIGPDDQIAVGGVATGIGQVNPAIWLFASDGTAGWSTIPADIGAYHGVAYGPGGLLYATGDYRTSQSDNDPKMILVRVGPSDTTAPTVTLAQAAGQADPTNTSPVNFSLVADEALDTTTVTAADFTVTNGTIGPIACSGTPTTCTIPVAPTADGAVTIAPSGSFSVADQAGNAQTTVGGTDRSVTYDTSGPVITASSKLQGTKVTVTFTVTGATSSTTCALDSADYATCTSPWTATLVKGTYTLHIQASDALGNPTAKDVSFTIKSGAKPK